MTRKIRIAHCIETMHLGGVEQTRLTLARGLDPDRYEQTVLCTKAEGALPAQFDALGCPVVVIGTFRSRIDHAVIGRATKALRAFKPDIVHGGVFEGVVTATFAGLAARAPIIVGEETADPVGRRWSGHLFMRLLTMANDRVVAVSPFVRDYLVNSLKIPARKVVLINNGVPDKGDLQEKGRRIRARFGLADEHFVIGSVGRLFDNQKRTSDLIRALPAVLSAHPEARLLIVGDGLYRGRLEEIAVEYGVSDRTVFAGYQPDPGPFLHAMDLFAHPAASEAFGLVLAEAMLAKLPVVATNVGGIPHVVENGVTATLIPPFSPDRLAQAIIALAGDPARRHAMGVAGRERALRLYGEDRYLREMDGMYSELVAAKKLLN